MVGELVSQTISNEFDSHWVTPVSGYQEMYWYYYGLYGQIIFRRRKLVLYKSVDGLLISFDVYIKMNWRYYFRSIPNLSIYLSIYLSKTCSMNQERHFVSANVIFDSFKSSFESFDFWVEESQEGTVFLPCTFGLKWSHLRWNEQ